jgi:hypothetical protein
MNKQIWKEAITEHECPSWPCRSCKSGVLALTPGSLQEHATVESMKHQNEDWWGFEHVVLIFSAWAECSNKKCNEKYVISGTGCVDQVPKDEYMNEYEYVNIFYPKYFHPTLQIFNLPENCPLDIETAMMEAFASFWQNKPVSAGRMRVTLERLLDHLGIPSKTVLQKPIALGNRIDHLSKTDPTNGAHLMALKWLGNVGSHTTDVDTDDLLDAFDVLEHVLTELIGKRSAAVAKLSAQLTAKYKK